MKDSSFMLSLIIPSPRSPGSDINVYLQPLIDELKDLWENGMQTYDVAVSSSFKLHAVLFWTINDFPAYGNLSGWSTKGRLACPNCKTNTMSFWLKHGRIHCFLGHHRYLPAMHAWRHDVDIFDGNKEFRVAPEEVTGEEILQQLESIPLCSFGKTQKKRK